MSSLAIVKTDTIIMEYVLLPIQDLHISILYRYTEPVHTGWTMGKISAIDIIKHPYTGMRLDHEAIKQFGLSQYHKMWLPQIAEINALSIEDQFVFSLDKIKIVECTIVPKE